MSRIRKTGISIAASSLKVRLDGASKRVLKKAAELRGISVSDYVRTVIVAQARREVDSAREQVVSLTAEEQLTFWRALQEPRPLSRPQRQLRRIMRGRE